MFTDAHAKDFITEHTEWAETDTCVLVFEERVTSTYVRECE